MVQLPVEIVVWLCAREKQSRLKQAAVRAVATARATGRLKPPTVCEACGRTGGRGFVWHHWDYRKPLDLIPLCTLCHDFVHRGRCDEPRTGRRYPRRGSDVPDWTVLNPEQEAEAVRIWQSFEVGYPPGLGRTLKTRARRHAALALVG